MAALDVEGPEGLDIPNSVLNRIIAVKEEHVRLNRSTNPPPRLTCTLTVPQEKFLEIDTAYKAERIAIEKKYFAQKVEIWKKRAEIVSGGAAVEAKVPVEEGDGERGGVAMYAYWHSNIV